MRYPIAPTAAGYDIAILNSLILVIVRAGPDDITIKQLLQEIIFGMSLDTISNT